MATEPHPSCPSALIIGYGDLGQAVGKILAANGWQVQGLRRSERSHEQGIQLLHGDVTQPATLAGLRAIDPHIVIYCVAATEQSDDHYRAHYVDGLRHVLGALDHAKHLRHVFFVSSTRVYGQESAALLSEADPAQPADFGGKRLLEAEQLLAQLPCGHTALRLSGIYGPGRLRMLQLAGDPARWPAQNAWSNRIHRDDVAAFVAFLAQRAMHGGPIAECYVVTDSCPAPQHEVLHWLTQQMGLAVPAAPSPDPSGGKRLSNTGMLATGFRLHYPDYQAGYSALLQQEHS